MDVNSASESAKKSSEDKNSPNSSSVDAQKITKFFPVLRTEGRAKMCASKTGDSKQKELLQKLKKKEGMTLRPKGEGAKPTVEQQPKTDSVPSPPNKEKIRNISVLAALKTPLSQVLRRSIEEAESKKELSEKNTQIIEKSSTPVEPVSVQEKKDHLSNVGSTEETVQKAKKSLSEGESGMSLRGVQKSSLSLRSSLTKKSSDGSPTPSVNLRKKTDLSESGTTKNVSSSRGSSAEEKSENGSSSNQNNNSAKARKNRKRHFRGSTYGLYLTPAKKKKKKQKSSHDESKDDECSLAGTENSSYLDSEDGNSLVSEDFYTPSEKSLADDEHNPDSRNSPMLSNPEPKPENTELSRSVEQQEDNSEIEQQEDNSEIEQQEDNSENCEQNIKLAESESNLIIPSACDEISQNATDILQHLDEMQWEPTQKFDDNSEENQFSSETLKAPQYDDISNESFSNSTIFPFKECAIENSEDGNIQEKDSNETEKSNEQTSADVVKEDNVNMTSEDRELLPEISENFMDVNENITDVFENKENSDPIPFEEAANDPDPDVDPDHDPDVDPDPDVDVDPDHNPEPNPDLETENVPPPVSEEKEEMKDKDNQELQSTIATCVKSRQRIKRRFTDDIVDTELGILSLSAMPAVRKVPAPKPDPPKDIIENFQSTTHSEAKKGPVTKIECIFNTHQNPVKNCTCEGDTYEANLGKDEEGVFCQAVDSIDDKLVGCSNPVVTTRLVRSSVKIPFTIMCEMHLWRLKHHHSCPYCGLFCSQGYFMQCTSSKHKKMVHLYHEQCQSKEEGHIPFCLHCGASTGLKRVLLEMQMANPPAFTLSQLSNVTLPVVSKARISYSATSEFLKKEEDELPHQTYTIDDTGKILSSAGLPNGTEKEELDKLLQILEETKVKSDIYSPDIFYDSAAKGDVLKVLYILAQGFDPNHKFPNHENETALHAAAAGGHAAIVHLLIQAGAVNDSLNEKMCSPLMLAVENNHRDAVHYLVKKGALVDFKGENGMSSLHLAAKIGNLDVLRILMSSRDVDVNSQDDGGWTPIVWASEHDHYNVVKYLLKRGANPNLKDSEGNTGLHWSAFSGSVDICYLYLDYGCDINAVNERGDTPIHIAARQDSFPCVTLFLSRGADVQIVNKANQLPAECCIDKNSDTYLSLSLNMLLKKITGKYQHKAEKILHRDISRGKEQIAIQCVNGVDDEPPPLDYLYVTENCETMPIKIDRTITSLQSCHCEDDCSSPSCTCSSISYQCWYDKEGLLVPEFNLLDPPMLFECNRACSCWSLNCHNRVLQNGITCRLQLIRTKGKGWGVRTLKDIPKGTFICEYVGELISDSAADKRSDDSYLFDLDNRDGETYCLDARYYGNISRFINHLCEPNLVPVKIYVDHQDLNFPRIAFFSSRDIKQYEELGFDYGEKFWAIKYKFFTCDCGSPKCKYSKETIHATIGNYYNRLKEEQLEEAAAQDQQAVVQPE